MKKMLIDLTKQIFLPSVRRSIELLSVTFRVS
jgi:hypothetical protein